MARPGRAAAGGQSMPTVLRQKHSDTRHKVTNRVSKTTLGPGVRSHKILQLAINALKRHLKKSPTMKVNFKY
jgi:hypothetical protein